MTDEWYCIMQNLLIYHFLKHSEDEEITYRQLMERSLTLRTLRTLGHRWDYNFKMNLQERYVVFRIRVKWLTGQQIVFGVLCWYWACRTEMLGTLHYRSPSHRQTRRTKLPKKLPTAYGATTAYKLAFAIVTRSQNVFFFFTFQYFMWTIKFLQKCIHMRSLLIYISL